jgi:hypothetical protein
MKLVAFSNDKKVVYIFSNAHSHHEIQEKVNIKEKLRLNDL